MAPQKTKDLLNQSFEKCFEELSEGLDMRKFMSNIKTLANTEKFNTQQLSLQSLDTKENVFKQEYFESNKQENEQQFDNQQEQILNKVKQKKKKNLSREEKFQQRLKKFNSNLEKILNEKVNSRKKKPKRCSSQFYERMRDYKQKNQERLENIRKQKQIKQQNQFSFKPKINRPQKSKNKFNFLQKMLLRSHEKKKKDDERKKNYDEYQKQIFDQQCTFKPKINRSFSHSKRNIDDLLLWKNQVDQKRKDQKEFLQEKFSFKPKITKKSKQIVSQKQNIFSNPGERLYREFLNKKQSNHKSLMDELRVDYQSNMNKQNPNKSHNEKNFEKNQLSIIKKKMNKKNKAKKTKNFNQSFQQIYQQKQLQSMNHSNGQNFLQSQNFSYILEQRFLKTLRDSIVYQKDYEELEKYQTTSQVSYKDPILKPMPVFLLNTKSSGYVKNNLNNDQKTYYKNRQKDKENLIKTTYRESFGNRGIRYC